MATVQELLGQIDNKEILLPEFQRGYVWNKNQVRSYMQSLYRGHPTGHFLIWKTYKPSKVRGGNSSSDGHSQLLLDGQQRLTSLYTIFRGSPPPFYEGEVLFFDLYFNVVTEEFRFFQKSIMTGDSSWISVTGFLGEGIQSFIKAIPTMEDAQRTTYIDHLDRLAQLDNIRNHPYQIDHLADEGLTVEDVVDIFNRVNSAGTPLTKADLAIAHVCSVWPDARAELREFAAEMKTHGFGIDLTFLIRCVSGTAANSVVLEGNFYRLPPEELQQAWKQVRTAFEYLVNVLRREAYIDSLSDIASAHTLIVPTVYLATHGSAFSDEVTKNRFIRWFYLANIWAAYTGQTETKLQKDISVLQNPDPTEALIARILDDRGRLHLEAKDVAGKGSTSSIYKFSYILARARAAKDWYTGQVLYNQAIGKSNGLESHHIFPTAILKKHGYAGREHSKIRNEAANRAFLTQKANRKISARAPADYLPVVQHDFPGALQAQAIPLNQDLWNVENFELFLADRQRLLAEATNTYIDLLVPEETVKDEQSTELLDLLGLDEHGKLEFKSTLRWDVRQKELNKVLEKVVAKTVAGFLNAKEGGILVIGVEDNKNVYGLEADYATLGAKGDRDGFELHLMNVITKYLTESVPVFLTVTFHEYLGKDICQVTVDPSDHPVYLKESANDYTFYARVGNATKPLPLPEVAKYVATRWG